MNFQGNVTSRRVANAGNGLFSTANIAAGTEILNVNRPLAYALDSPNLQSKCANCFRDPSEDLEANWGGEELKRCMGCKVVKYCDTVRYV